jgi:translation initiation factor IF-2
LAKGIRVNQLAKELGVTSKDILDKCRAEGLAEKVPNHMSVLSIGLSETVREWFSSVAGSGAGGTAVETAPPVEVATKPKKSRTTGKKKADAGDEDAGGNGSATDDASTADVARAEPGETLVTAEPSAPVAPSDAPAVSPVIGSPAKVMDAPDAGFPSVVPPPAHVSAPHFDAPAMQPPPLPPSAQPLRPAASVAAPPAAPPSPSAPTPGAGGPAARPTIVPDLTRPPVSRPTISLGPSRGTGPATVERKPVVVAPKLTELQPASIQGPKVVRVEKADNLPPPRRPMGPRGPANEGAAGPGYAVARPQTGRGVKISDEEEEEARKKALQKAGAAGRTNSQRRRGPDGRRGEAMEKLREFSEADLEERRIRLGTASVSRAVFEGHLKKGQQRGLHPIARTGAQRGEPLEIEEPITVKSLSAVLGIKGTEIVRKLFLQGVRDININSGLDNESAATIALEYGVELVVAQEATMEEELVQEFEARETDPANLLPRPPVVTILGHVDHGKTSLLDKIRNASVAAGEAGGITQHTAAWQVTLGEGEDEKQVTFIDTPGHQAFTSMRARGANMTDVVVLVVSAAEGVQPQTIESINHARAAEVPIVVALNKIDRPDANPDMVLGQLAAQGLNPVEWGGDTEVVRTSAVTGQGIKDLIEILHYQAELLELKADPTAPARGVVIESRIDPGLGSVATVLVQDGTLTVGDVILCGPGYGRIRSLLNDRGEMVQEAFPATPVIVSGLNEMPSAGDRFYVVTDYDRARTIAEERVVLSRHQELSGKTQVSLSNLMETIKLNETKTINLIIKGDVQGSVETLQKTVTDQNTEEVRVRVIHAAVGGINESDVELASAGTGAVIIGFNVVPDESARQMAEQRRVEIRLYRVIYEIFDDLKKALSGLLAPEIREKLHGHIEVRQVFKVSRLGNVAGCFVTDGHIQRGSKIRLTRGGTVITEDLSIETLRRIKEDVREVKAGFECGIKLANYDDIKVGDIMEAYIRETIQRTL